MQLLSAARPAPTSIDVREVLGLHSDPAQTVRARAVTVRVGTWRPDREPGQREAPLPMVVAEGALLRTVVLRGREGADLLGPGDLLRHDADDGVFETRYRSLTRCTIGLLDDRVRHSAANDPALLCALCDAAVRRASVLSMQVVLAQLTAIDDRLRILFPFLAERWGRVTAEGVVLPAFLSHTALSALVGARRPSLTAAVGRMVEDGTVRRLSDRRWLLAPALAAVA